MSELTPERLAELRTCDGVGLTDEETMELLILAADTLPFVRRQRDDEMAAAKSAAAERDRLRLRLASATKQHPCGACRAVLSYRGNGGDPAWFVVEDSGGARGLRERAERAEADLAQVTSDRDLRDEWLGAVREALADVGRGVPFIDDAAREAVQQRAAALARADALARRVEGLEAERAARDTFIGREIYLLARGPGVLDAAFAAALDSLYERACEAGSGAKAALAPAGEEEPSGAATTGGEEPMPGPADPERAAPSRGCDHSCCHRLAVEGGQLCPQCAGQKERVARWRASCDGCQRSASAAEAEAERARKEPK